MTAFIKQNFINSGDYLMYEFEGVSHFIARFKYRGGNCTKAQFKNALAKLYSVEEYLERVKTEAPLRILMNDGHYEFDSENKKFIRHW